MNYKKFLGKKFFVFLQKRGDFWGFLRFFEEGKMLGFWFILTDKNEGVQVSGIVDLFFWGAFLRGALFWKRGIWI